jgi:cytochrome b6-f complex iron-sulfur subunit
VSRREFFRRSLLTSVSLFGAQFGAASLAFLWPNLRGGFGSVIELGLSPEAVKNQIQSDRLPFYFGAGRFYLVNYEGDGTDTVYAGLVGDGLMALYQKCVHLGCRVPWCQTSQWFECPCHGSKYNRAGEYRDGPAPRSMDRFAVRVVRGQVQVDTSQVVLGPPRGTDTIGQNPEGPFCVNIGGE